MSTLPIHLVSVAAKIVWAEKHYKALNAMLRRHLDECRQAIRFTADINVNQGTLRISQNVLPEADVRISLMIGDCVHNARSSLDTLWKRLKPEGNFPIFADIDGKNGWNAKRSNILAGIPVGAHAIINGLQPGSKGQDARSHPLAILNKLAKIDKHETFHLIAAHSADTSFVFFDDDRNVVATIRPSVVFDETTDYVLTRLPDGLKSGMKMDVNGTMYVAFKEVAAWRRNAVQDILTRCIKFIRGSVVAPLAPFTK